jgi:O-antigen/teichoic acid export membrane protein
VTQDSAGDVRTNEELTAAMAVGLRWITYSRMGIEVLQVVSMIVLARLIPPAAFGMVATVAIVQELTLTLPMEGLSSALVQRPSITREHLRSGLLLGMVGGLLLAAATLLLSAAVVVPAYGVETAHLMELIAPCFLLGAATAIPLAVLRRRLDFKTTGLIAIVSTLSRTAVTVALAVAGLDAPALVLGTVAGLVVGLAMALRAAPIPLPGWNSNAVRELLPYGGPASLACLAWAGFRNGDYAIIGARLGPFQAGLYWRGYTLAVDYQRKVSTVMAEMAFPVLSRTAGKHEMHALRRRMVQLLTVTLFPLLVVLVLTAPIVVPLLFGPAWEGAVRPAQILAAGGAATLVIDAAGSTLAASGRSKAMLGYGVAHFAVYATAVWMVADRGLPAVAVTASVVHTIFLFAAYQLLLRDRPVAVLRALWGDVAAATTSCVAMLAASVPAALLLDDDIGVGPLVQLVLIGGVGTLAYLVALRVLFPAAWRDALTALRRLVPVAGLRLLARLPKPAVARRPSTTA